MVIVEPDIAKAEPAVVVPLLMTRLYEPKLRTLPLATTTLVPSEGTWIFVEFKVFQRLDVSYRSSSVVKLVSAAAALSDSVVTSVGISIVSAIPEPVGTKVREPTTVL